MAKCLCTLGSLEARDLSVTLSASTREGPDGQTTSHLSLLPTVHAAGLCRDPTGLA